MKEKRMTIRLNKDIDHELRRLAKQRGESLSIIIREAFNSYIARGEGVIKEDKGSVGEESKSYGNH